jgi:protein-S-isoprenylcysteine O-methyltransferase Ste14
MKKLVLLPPPLVAIGLLTIAYLLNKNPPNLQISPATSGGLAWLATGVALSISAFLQFRELSTTALPNGKPTQLVTLGAYLWTRNPMYLGMLTALIGIALYEGTLAFWLVPPAFFLIINQHHIPYEEAKLSDIFGDRYLKYAKKSRRWI